MKTLQSKKKVKQVVRELYNRRKRKKALNATEILATVTKRSAAIVARRDTVGRCHHADGVARYTRNDARLAHEDNHYALCDARYARGDTPHAQVFAYHTQAALPTIAATLATRSEMPAIQRRRAPYQRRRPRRASVLSVLSTRAKLGSAPIHWSSATLPPGSSERHSFYAGHALGRRGTGRGRYFSRLLHY